MLDYTDARSYKEDPMPEPSVMRFDEGFDRGIRSRFISEWFRMDSYVPGKENLLTEIDGIETSKIIRNQFDVQLMYV
jgi:hypothetical protein